MDNKIDAIINAAIDATRDTVEMKRFGSQLTAKIDGGITLDVMLFKDGTLMFWLDRGDVPVLMVTIEYSKFSVEYIASFIAFIIKDIAEGKSEVINKFFDC